MTFTAGSGKEILFWRAVRNGFVAWMIGTGLYMIPALVVGFQMGFTLGPKVQNSAEISRQISEAITAMYRGNMFLVAGYFVAIALLVFWRARVVSRAATGKRMQNGAIVGAVPAVLEILFLTAGIGGIYSVVAAAVYVAVGAFAGSRSATVPPSTGAPMSI